MFFDLSRECYHRSLRRARKLGRYLGLGQYFPVQIEKAVVVLADFDELVIF